MGGDLFWDAFLATNQGFAMYLTASLREFSPVFSSSPRKNAAIMCVSSVDPITIINEGIIALRILSGIPIQPNIPKVQIIVSSDVTNGTMADNQLRMNIKMAKTIIAIVPNEISTEAQK